LFLGINMCMFVLLFARPMINTSRSVSSPTMTADIPDVQFSIAVQIIIIVVSASAGHWTSMMSAECRCCERKAMKAILLFTLEKNPDCGVTDLFFVRLVRLYVVTDGNIN
jgi:hypothetical protein